MAAAVGRQFDACCGYYVFHQQCSSAVFLLQRCCFGHFYCPEMHRIFKASIMMTPVRPTTHFTIIWVNTNHVSSSVINIKYLMILNKEAIHEWKAFSHEMVGKHA